MALDVAPGLLVVMVVDPNGHDNAAKLVPRLLPTLRCGTDRQGRPWTDERGTLASPREGTRTVRRITLMRPGRDPIVLVTDLLDAEAFPANDLLELSRPRRWIEIVFQKVSEVFHLRHLIGSSPLAIAFQAALCMVLYNLLQVVRGLLAQTQRRAAATVSTHRLFADLHKQLTVLNFFADPETIAEARRRRMTTVGNPQEYLSNILQIAWKPKWIRSPPKRRSFSPTNTSGTPSATSPSTRSSKPLKGIEMFTSLADAAPLA